MGAGANGRVYLVRRGKISYALKVGLDALDHQSEINALRALSKTSTSFKGYLIDVDDFSYEGQEIPFSVLKYIEGTTLSNYIQNRGKDWVYVVGSRFLQKLAELHASGYVFGDIKPENIMLSGYGDVDLIDFGGVTIKGRAVKQFTELYDRGYWGCGDRVAEDSYDLFSFAVLILKALDERDRFAEFQQALPQNRGIDLLQSVIRENDRARQIAPFLHKALQGEFSSSKEAYQSWRGLILKTENTSVERVKASWLKVCFAASLLLFGATLYVYW